MATEARLSPLSRRPPSDRNSGILEKKLESTAPEVGAVVDVQRFRQTGGRPRFGDLALPQPGRLVEDG
ncbi:hypothetical protein M8037_18330, partial [Sinorhizobium meliloti]|uniref:hypothetical protein n=1 Tax=Rhizobium meliloti TaxID=382 RepID=UPI002072ECE9